MLSIVSIKVALPLPDGFFLEEGGILITLCYGGPGFQSLTETGGKKPKSGATHASLGAVGMRTSLGPACAYFEEKIRRIQAEIAAATATAS